MAGVVGCLILFTKGFLHLAVECPGFLHLKHKLFSIHFCPSSGMSCSRQAALMSMVFRSLICFIFLVASLKWEEGVSSSLGDSFCPFPGEFEVECLGIPLLNCSRDCPLRAPFSWWVPGFLLRRSLSGHLDLLFHWGQCCFWVVKYILWGGGCWWLGCFLAKQLPGLWHFLGWRKPWTP